MTLSTASTPAAGTLSNWILQALSTPAFLRYEGRVFPATHRVYAAWACRAVGEAARQFFETTVSIEPAEGGGFTPSVVVSMQNLAGADVALIALDLEAARAVANGVGVKVAEMRGVGTINAAELAMIEYAALELTDGVLKASGLAHSGVLVGAVRGGDEAARGWAMRQVGAVLPLRIAVGPTGGRGAVALLGACPAAPSAGPSPGTLPGGRVDIALALPAFAFPVQELRAMQPGDAVLLGIDDFAGAVGSRLVTRSLWRLGGAVILSDAPTHLTVSAERVAPEPDDGIGMTAPEGHCAACVLLGSATASAAELGAFADQWRLTLRKTPGEEAILIADGCEAARGELVRADDQLAMRITRLCSGSEVEG